MSRYYNNTQDILPFTKARAADIEAGFDAVDAGLDIVETEMDRALRANPADTAINYIPNAATRANKGLVFDGTGQPAVQTIATDAQMTAAVNAANTAISEAAAATASASAAATSAGAAAPTMVIVTGTTVNAVHGSTYVLTNAAATTVTLPSSPVAGWTVGIMVANDRSDNVVARNGANIMSLAENMDLTNRFASFFLRFTDATRGWRIL